MHSDVRRVFQKPSSNLISDGNADKFRCEQRMSDTKVSLLCFKGNFLNGLEMIGRGSSDPETDLCRILNPICV